MVLIDKFLYFWLVQLHNLFSFMPFQGRAWQPNITVRVLGALVAVGAGVWFVLNDPNPLMGWSNPEALKGWIFFGGGLLGLFVEWRMWSYLGGDYLQHLSE